MNFTKRAAYNSHSIGIPSRQVNDSPGLGKVFLLTFGSKGTLQNDNVNTMPRAGLHCACNLKEAGEAQICQLDSFVMQLPFGAIALPVVRILSFQRSSPAREAT